MNSKILITLSKLGFLVEPLGEHGYSFNHEGLKYIYRLKDDGDGEGFLQMFVLTNIDATVCGPFNLYYLMDKTNDGVRYVKACLLGDSICLYYENSLFGYEDYQPMLCNMICAIESAFMFLHSALKDIQVGDDEFKELTGSDDGSDNLIGF